MTPIVVQRIQEESSGAGEEVLPAVVAAIGNAFFDATGVQAPPVSVDAGPRPGCSVVERSLCPGIAALRLPELVQGKKPRRREMITGAVA